MCVFLSRVSKSFHKIIHSATILSVQLCFGPNALEQLMLAQLYWKDLSSINNLVLLYLTTTPPKKKKKKWKKKSLYTSFLILNLAFLNPQNFATLKNTILVHNKLCTIYLLPLLTAVNLPLVKQKIFFNIKKNIYSNDETKTVPSHGVSMGVTHLIAVTSSSY